MKLLQRRPPQYFFHSNFADDLGQFDVVLSQIAPGIRVLRFVISGDGSSLIILHEVVQRGIRGSADAHSPVLNQILVNYRAAPPSRGYQAAHQGGR